MTSHCLRLNVLGTGPVVPSRSEPPLPVRGQSIELLVYLVAAGGQASYSSIFDDLFPDAPLRRTQDRLHMHLYDLRRFLADTAGAEHQFIQRTPTAIRVDRDLVDTDLWQLEQALREADTVREPLLALRRAVTICAGGEFAEGRLYDWAAPQAYTVHQHMLDAHLRLAAELGGRDSLEAIMVLHAALDRDPLAAPCYRHLMDLHASRRELDWVAGLRNRIVQLFDAADLESGPLVAHADRLLPD